MGLKKILMAGGLMAACLGCQWRGPASFVVQGQILGANDKMVVLAELPLNQRHRLVVDSMRLDSTGRYQFTTLAQPECFYQVFVQNGPSFLLINDAETIGLDANADQPEQYTVRGSAASASLQRYDAGLQARYAHLQRAQQRADSVAPQKNMADSLKLPFVLQRAASADSLQRYLATVIGTEPNGTAQYYMLGYAKTLATKTTWQTLLQEALKKHPKHAGLLALTKQP
ncbi:MAG: hypothetical protein EAY75_11600 [Bacteroidetes bacterium]|nr:MAG: hypothetical protein EAY75_11600 [Bacteroidota bacterium]